MLAYNNDVKFKERFLKEVKWHQDQDAIVQGVYIGYTEGREVDLTTNEVQTTENLVGCAVGCSVVSLDKANGVEVERYYYDQDGERLRERMSEMIGLPLALIEAEELVFEHILTKEQYKSWPYKFAEAVNVGANYEEAAHKIKQFVEENITSAMISKLANTNSVFGDLIAGQVLDMIRAVKPAALEAPAIEMVISEEGDLFVPDFTLEDVVA